MPLGGPEPGAAETPVPGTVDEIADRLREDPVLLSTMLGNGHAAALREALHTKLDASQVPVFVVLTRTPVGMEPSSADEDIATLVHARLGQDGVYVVQTSQGYGHVGVWGDLDTEETNDETLLSLATYTASDQVDARLEERYGEDIGTAPALQAALIMDVLAGRGIPDYEQPVLTDAAVDGYTDAIWISQPYRYDGDVEPFSLGLGALVGVSVGLVVAAAAFRSLRLASALVLTRGGRSGGPAPRTRPRSASPSSPTVATDPRTALAAQIRAALDDLAVALERSGTRTVGPERLALAVGSRDVVAELVDSDDLLDLVGASVLLRTATAALDGEQPYRCCYLDPRHGRGRHEMEVAAGISVPVCRPCQRDLEAGREPAPLLERRRGRDRPYYAGGSVWARTGFGTLSDDLWRDVRTDRAP